MEKDGTTLVMPDITKGCMLVTIYGSEIALIENFKSIIEYSDSIIKLQGKQKRLVIRGRELSIERYTKGDCKESISVAAFTEYLFGAEEECVDDCTTLSGETKNLLKNICPLSKNCIMEIV